MAAWSESRTANKHPFIFVLVSASMFPHVTYLRCPDDDFASETERVTSRWLSVSLGFAEVISMLVAAASGRHRDVERFFWMSSSLTLCQGLTMFSG